MARKISIEADSLKKIYKNREVVKSVSLAMEKGEVVGLLDHRNCKAKSRKSYV